VTPIELVALVGALLVLVKFVLLLCCPHAVLDWARSLLRKPEVLMILYGVIAVVLSYLVLQAVGIVVFMACAFLASALIKMSYVPYFGAFDRVLAAMPRTPMGFFAKSWFAVFIWGFLAVWTLVAVLG